MNMGVRKAPLERMGEQNTQVNVISEKRSQKAAQRALADVGKPIDWKIRGTNCQTESMRWKTGKASNLVPQIERFKKGAAVGAGIGAAAAITGIAAHSLLKKSRDREQRLSSALRMIEFYDISQPRHKDSNRFAPVLDSLATRKELVDANGKPFVMTNHHVLRAAYNEGQKHRVVAQRTYRVGRDLTEVAQGKPKQPGHKREWEKAWVGNVLTAGAIGVGALGVVGLRRYARMPGNANKPLSKMVMKTENKIAETKDAVVKHAGNFVNSGLDNMGLNEEAHAAAHVAAKTGPKIVASGIKKKKPKVNLASALPLFRFDSTADERGWDLRDARGKSARVYAPGSKQRFRRPADWHETKNGQRNILIGAGAMGALGAAAIGSTIAYKVAGKKAAESLLAKQAAASKVVKKKVVKKAVETVAPGVVLPFKKLA